MSKALKSVASDAPPARDRAGSPDHSSSDGIHVRAEGWRIGFDKVGFTRLLRKGGYRLTDAIDLTGRLLENERLELRLTQFADFEAARCALESLGVQQIAQPQPVP